MSIVAFEVSLESAAGHKNDYKNDLADVQHMENQFQIPILFRHDFFPIQGY